MTDAPRQRRRQRMVETVAVSTERRASGDSMDTREVVDKNPVPLSGAAPAYVRVEGSVTQNMGNYNSVRVGIAIERPCENTDEAIQRTYTDLSSRVDTMVRTELEVATGGQSGEQ